MACLSKVYLEYQCRDHPFYWYFHLKTLGKQKQTKELVDQAVKDFTANDHKYMILEYVAKKYLTYDVCINAIKRNGMNLKYVPEQYRDNSMCYAAVQNDGEALEYVPKEILCGDRGFEICFTAVCNDFSGAILSLVPKSYLRGKRGKGLCETAVRENGHALKYVPPKMITEVLVRLAIETPFPVRDILSPDGSHSERRYYSVLEFVPEKFMSEELVILAVRLYPENLKYAPSQYISPALCSEVVEKNPKAISVVPDKMLTIELCKNALRRAPDIKIQRFPEHIRKELEQEFSSEPIIKYKPIELKMPEFMTQNELTIPDEENVRTHDLTVNAGFNNNMIYYITDIHLEHQIIENLEEDICKLSQEEIRYRIKNKIREIIKSVPDTSATLLIGGDVADSIELEMLFYEQLSSLIQGWRGRIISILGNHELWDGNPTALAPVRLVDEIIDDYKKALQNRTKITLLENALFVDYKECPGVIIDEQTILNASIEELTEICANSTFLLLGGIGFSGLNPSYNASMGLYRATGSREEDIMRSQRFRAIYEKILESAGNLQVIVLTHTQMEDWSDSAYNPNWIYVNGHTHQNTFRLKYDGITVFSDNQVGYKPKRWYLKGFAIDVRRYDPFESYADGIYPITCEQYIVFNRCQGIVVQGMTHPGDVYVLKRDGTYMFVLKNQNNLYYLEGGKRHNLKYDIQYYYDNLPIYIRKVRNAVAPYQKMLCKLSNEVKAIGGRGRVHGFIVDIDQFHHVYLNPFDGKVTLYYATDKTNKLAFENVKSLLEKSPRSPQLYGESIYNSSVMKEGGFSLLNLEEPVIAPRVVLDREMYGSSGIMRSIQYLLEQNVLRFWDDKILLSEEKDDIKMLADSQ